MVGHTHEDIDQRFSCFSRYLHKHSAVTMEGTYIRMHLYRRFISSSPVNQHWGTCVHYLLCETRIASTVYTRPTLILMLQLNGLLF